MRAKKQQIRHLNQLPDWFNIDNYSVLSTLSGSALIKELDSRAKVYNALKDGPEPEGNEEPTFYELAILSLEEHRSEDPFGHTQCCPPGQLCRACETEQQAVERVERDGVNCINDERIKLGLYAYELARSPSVRPLDIMTLSYVAEQADADNLLLSDREECKFIRHCKDSVSAHYPNGHRFLLEIDLESATDEEIVKQLLGLLPAWREKTDSKVETATCPSVGESTIRKLLDYRLIPWLDLMNWSLETGNQITKAVLARALFPDDINKDRNWLSDKNKGGMWFKRATDLSYINALKAFLCREHELSQRPVGRYG